MWETLLEPDGEYAAGWFVGRRPWASGPVYWHTGSNNLWWAVAVLAPSVDRVFLAASNAATFEAQQATDRIISRLIRDG